MPHPQLPKYDAQGVHIDGGGIRRSAEQLGSGPYGIQVDQDIVFISVSDLELRRMRDVEGEAKVPDFGKRGAQHLWVQ